MSGDARRHVPAVSGLYLTDEGTEGLGCCAMDKETHKLTAIRAAHETLEKAWTLLAEATDLGNLRGQLTPLFHELRSRLAEAESA